MGYGATSLNDQTARLSEYNRRKDGLEQRFGFFSRRRVFEVPTMSIASSAVAGFEAGECFGVSVEKLSSPSLFELDAFEVRSSQPSMNLSELALRLSIVGAPVVGRSARFLYGINDQNLPFRYCLAAREIDRFFGRAEPVDRYSLTETPEWVE